MNLINMVCLVTGAGKGIGRAIAEELVKQGATVVLADIDEDQLKTTCDEINQGLTGDAATAYVCDISDPKRTKSLIENMVERFGKIDVLVNNAGVASSLLIDEITPEQWDRTLNINLRGTMFLSQYAFIEMKKKKSGKIINIASLAGERGGKFAGIDYSASKAGVIMLTKCYALNGGEHGVTCNAIAPGLIETDLSRELKFNTDEIPMKKLGSAKNVADAVVFLASEEAAYVNGTTLDVNGGIDMR